MRFSAGIFLLLILTTAKIFAQKPEPPVLQYVSIDPETGFTYVKWDPSPSASTDYYLIYEIMSNGAGNPITPAIYDTEYYSTYDLPHFHPVGFTVVGVDDGGSVGTITYGDWSRIDSTIYLEAAFDTCKSVITLAWNDYSSWRGHIREYNIYRYMAPYMYYPVLTVSGTANTAEITGALPNQTYDLFVEAVHEDGIRRSMSNRNAVETRVSEVPVSINADYATLGPGNSIDVSFTIAGSAKMTDYNILKSNSFDGTYTLVKTIRTDGSNVSFNDKVPFTSGIQFYKLEVLNACGVPALQSNRANNIILSGTFINMDASMEWNEYRDWSGGVMEYNLIRTIGRKNSVTDTIYSGSNTFMHDDLSGMVNYQDPEEGVICYSVQGIENTNILGLQGKSLSNQVCFSINPQVRIPNAFIPNDATPENQVFEPVFSFLPEHYEMIIYNRLGLKIWEGTEPWDGRVNGNFVPEGVYLYFLRVFSYSSEISEFNGKVTVLYR
jgi:hypothetical protein